MGNTVTVGERPKQRRVVVTGIGINCPLGINADDVSANLRAGKSGVTAAPDFLEAGFLCGVVARVPEFQMPELANKDVLKSSGDGRLIKFLLSATHDAIRDSGLTQEQLHKAGGIIGTGGPSTIDQIIAMDKLRDKKKSRYAGPRRVLSAMGSGGAALVCTAFELRAFNLAISAACATSAICIGEAAQKIILGKSDIAIAGGADAADIPLAVLFDAMPAMCADRNDQPKKASRPFDATRGGFVLGEGAGILVLEELEHAKARGARIYAELIGYGTSSDGKDLTNPDQDGAERSMRDALVGFDGVKIPSSHVQYLNTHGTSTPNGDANELRAIHGVFGDGDNAPDFSSTKSMTGHSLGGAGAQEAIYCLLMMRDDFIAPTINVEVPDPLLDELCLTEQLVTTTQVDRKLDYVMSNSFGFGGVNATLLFRRYAA